MRRRSHEVHAALAKLLSGQVAGTLESQTLDFKEEKRVPEETERDIAEAAICFANAQGGVVVLGVSDKVPGPAALKGTALNIEHLQKRVHDLSMPALLVDIEEQRHGEVRLLVIYVPQSPVLHADPKGRATRRVGVSCVPMTPDDQMRLREERAGIDWSAQLSERAMEEVSRNALDTARQSLATFTDERRKYARLTDRDLLTALGVLSPGGALLRAGELLFCPPKDGPTPAVLYQYRLTPGGEPRAIERIETPLVLAFQRTMELIQARRNITPVTLPDGQQIQIADFPELAVREAIANAFIHRDYHIAGPVVIEHSPEVLAVTSPGPLVSGVTPENILTHHSKPRNPALAKAARVMGLAEEVGRGVDRMYREMIRSGRDIPKIENIFDRVRVTLVGGAPNTQIARYVAQLPEHERDDTDTMLVLFRLCASRTATAEKIAPLLQKTEEEAEAILRRLTTPALAMLEATRYSLQRAHSTYRLRGEALKALGNAVTYQRRTVDEIDRKIIAHLREYGTVSNRTVQNIFDVTIQRARDLLADLVRRQVIVKTSFQQRGPSVEYGPGAKFPEGKSSARGKARKQPQGELPFSKPTGKSHRKKS